MRARAKGKRKGKADPGAAMAYMRRLHGGPSVTADPAPVADLADLAEQTTDPIEKKNNNKRRQAR